MFEKYENTNRVTLTGTFLTTLKSVIISMIFTAAALVLLAFLVTYGPVSESAINICVKAATLISVFFAAIMGAGKIKSRGWLIGLLTGITYILIMFCISGLAFENTSFGGNSLKTMLFSVLAGTAGGILGVNIRRKNKK